MLQKDVDGFLILKTILLFVLLSLLLTYLDYYNASKVPSLSASIRIDGFSFLKYKALIDSYLLNFIC